MARLTPKQENFCQKYIELGNASEAYRQSYDASKMKPETIKRKAQELLNHGTITATIEALQAEHKKRHNITVDDLITELEEARIAALTCETPQSSAAVSATMGKAKILGFDKQVVEHTGKDGNAIQHNHNISLQDVLDARQQILDEY